MFPMKIALRYETSLWNKTAANFRAETAKKAREAAEGVATDESAATKAIAE